MTDIIVIITRPLNYTPLQELAGRWFTSDREWTFYQDPFTHNWTYGEPRIERNFQTYRTLLRYRNLP